MKKKLNLPLFKSEKEESEFWANLDLAEYFEPSDFKQVAFPNLKPTKQLISIRLPEQLLVEVKDQAKKRSVPYQSLIQQFIQQGLQSSK